MCPDAIYNLGGSLGKLEKRVSYMRPQFRVELDESVKITPSGAMIDDELDPQIAVTSIKTHASLDALTNDANIELSAPLKLDSLPETVKIYLGYSSQKDLFLVYTGDLREITCGTSNSVAARSHAAPVMKARLNMTMNQKGSDDVIKQLVVKECGVKEASGKRKRSDVHKSKYVVPQSVTVFDYVKTLCEEADLWAYMSQKDEFVLAPHDPRPASKPGGLKKKINSGTTDQFEHVIDPGEVIEWGFATKGSDVSIFSVAYAEYGSDKENLLTSEYKMLKGHEARDKPRQKDGIVLPYTSKDVAEKVIRNLEKRRAGHMVGELTILGRPEIRICDSISAGEHKNGIVTRVSHLLDASTGFVTEIEAEFEQKGINT
jgi:hypothetical protein